MKRLGICLTVILCNTMALLGQSEPPSAPRYANCVKSRSFRRATLNNFYPFKNTTRIEVVSFKSGHGYESAPTLNGVIDQSKFIESKVLSKDEEEELVDILYNYTFDPKVNKDSIVTMVAICYEPRNAIIFKDKNGQIRSWLEICFECERSAARPKKIEVVEFCDGKFDMLKSFMIKTGIKYGTIETDEVLEDKSHK